jgi:methionyl-tRNA synthetase
MKFYITTAIDYINGKPHIGHSYEKVAADVLARFNRLKSADVFFLTGTDEHGSKIAQYAKEQKKDPQEFADQTAVLFKQAWDNLDISYDRFIRTTDPDHIKCVQEIYQKIKDNGYLYEGEYTGLYCIGHEAFITEKELINGLCPDHKVPPEKITEKNWFLKISAFTDLLAKKIKNDEFKIWPQTRRHEILTLLEQGFNDIAVSRPNVKWGIPLPWDKNQTIYVWVDALINYVSGVGFAEDQEKFKKYWPADWHVIGNDIIKFHCIIWPAMLMAAGIELPKGVLVHGMFTVAGEKMSKSIGNVIDPNDWVAKYGSDAVRYLLMREVPFGQDGDVSEEKLRSRYEGDLANGLGNLVSRLTNMIEKYCNGNVPEITHPQDKLDEVGELIETFRFHDALIKIWQAVAWANEYIDKNKPWQLAKSKEEGGDPEKLNKILAELSAEVYFIALMLAPFIPLTAERIRKAFEGEKISKINNLFPKIE